jgi:hypothetical protein
MPYHLEKGPTLRVIEKTINADPERAWQRICRSQGGPLDWLLGDDATQATWNDPALHEWAARAKGTEKKAQSPQAAIARDWFGYRLRGGKWAPESPPTKNKPLTTGYWIAYDGDVNAIVRRTLCWALDIALDPDENGKPRRAWELELFWKCPSPWFEGWVLGGNDKRRVVSVIFVTPANRGANVAESPIATQPTTKNPNKKLKYPVPSTQADYLEITDSLSAQQIAAARNRAYSTWVVTHAKHITTGIEKVTTNPVGSGIPTDYADWKIPQLAIYSGYQKGSNPRRRGAPEPIVIVSPSQNAGGVKADGSVP